MQRILKVMSDDSSGVLVLAATPIGDDADASPALLRALGEADVIVAEDTRRAQRLFSRLDLHVDAPLISCFEGNERERIPELLGDLRQGKRLVLITDAGMPVVSDPGYRLVNAAIEEEIRVTAVPGPSAVLTALALSGLPSDRFCFEGFLPRKPGERRRKLSELVDEQRTLIFFEAVHRLADFLADMRDAFGPDRQAAVCRELTKTYEEVKRGNLEELAEWAKADVRGEITIVVHGAQQKAPDAEAALAQVMELVERGDKLSFAVTEVARSTGVRRKSLYDAALAAKKEDN